MAMLMDWGLGRPVQKGYLLVIGLEFGMSREMERALITERFVI